MRFLSLLKKTICGLRHYSILNTSNTLEHLETRTLLKVSGRDVVPFLQGLITNDMKHLTEGTYCMYSMFLNLKGRVLYDTIIYKTPNIETFLIECDKNIVTQLQKHLNMYKVKKAIDIEPLQDKYKVYALFDPDILMHTENTTTPKAAMSMNQAIVINETVLYRDPRMQELGVRVLAPENANLYDEISTVGQIAESHPDKSYNKFRYMLGVAEGIQELPPGVRLPLEVNMDYMHGVSFHKGCYIGQELTARSYHTGVIRKRMMPLFFSEKVTKVPEEKNIMRDNVRIGVLVGVEDNVGLAILKMESVLNTPIQIGDYTATTVKPCWWPLEVPKEKVNV